MWRKRRLRESPHEQNQSLETVRAGVLYQTAVRRALLRRRTKMDPLVRPGAARPTREPHIEIQIQIVIVNVNVNVKVKVKVNVNESGLEIVIG